MTPPDLTLIKVFADARTEPHLPSGSAVLLIQNGKVSVAKFHYERGDTFSIDMTHPLNDMDLSVRAIALIVREHPEYLKSETALTLVFPEHIAKDMIWSN